MFTGFMMKQDRSQEGGILSRLIPLLYQNYQVTPQTSKRVCFTFLWLLLVTCGHFGLFGIVFSTFSAQFCRRIDLCVPINVTGGSLRNSSTNRRSRSGNKTSSSDASLPSASYARYSSDMQHGESIDDQQRLCREMAEREGLTIAPDLEFYDAAVSGTKRYREGLDAMLQAAKDGRFGCLFFYNISRLARESVITLPMLKQLVYVDKVRVVSVTEGVDSKRDGWEMLAALLSVMAERYVKELGLSVFRGQEGTALAGYSVGDFCFGYKSVPVAGSESQRRSRNAKPRMTYAIDELAAPWVVQIFDWFAKEGRSIRWITRELNRLNAPKDHRSTTKPWHHQYVSRLLENRKYIGIWPWAEQKNERNPMTGDVRQEPRPTEETEKWIRSFPQLRIIDDQTWAAAQERLAANKKRHQHRHKSNGTWNGSKFGDAANHPRHLLSGLLQCRCGAFLNVGGTDGR